MVRRITLPILSSVFLVAGCATAPLPEQFSDANNGNDEKQETADAACKGPSRKLGVIDIGSGGVDEGFVFDVCPLEGKFNAFKILSTPQKIELTKDFPKQSGFHFKQSLDSFSDAWTCDTFAANDTGYAQIRNIFLQVKRIAPEIRAAATAAFRASVNGNEYIEKVERCLNESEPKPIVTARVVSQALEGELEFRASVHKWGKALLDKKNPTVWGFGSTSTQFTVLDKNSAGSRREFLLVDGGDGAVNFCRWVAGVDEDSDVCKGETSPNLTARQREEFNARKGVFVREKNTPAYLRKVFRDAHVFGIGGGHHHLDVGSKPTYLLNDVSKQLDLYVKAKPTGKFAAHKATNLLLVEGVMESMGIASVTRDTDRDLSLAHGLAVMEDW